MLLTNLHCNDCQKDFQFIDNIDKNRTNLSKDECVDYSLSLIKKTNENNFEYIVNVNCNKCNGNIYQTFTEKENNFHFKCRNCPLNGISFNYFLSQEEDNAPKSENRENKNLCLPTSEISDNNYPIPINSSNMYTNQPTNSYQSSEQKYTNRNNSEDTNPRQQYENPFRKQEVEAYEEVDNVPKAQSALNNKQINISNVDASKRGMKTQNLPNKKIYTTPQAFEQKQIKIIFVKNNSTYEFYFSLSDSIISQLNKIKEKIDISDNAIYYYNSQLLDINKTFKENKICNGAFIEIDYS